MIWLAWRYICFHRWRTVVLWVCLSLTFFLPFSVQFLMQDFERVLQSRSDATPLVVGAKGSRFDLVIHALYFGGETPEAMSMADLNAVRETGFAQAIPLFARYQARGFPIVGTSLDYFLFRGLEVEDGRGLVHLGDCVLGASVAAELSVGVGESLMSDPENVFNIAGEYPLKMNVVGVLKRSDSADDRAVFVDTKTAWIIAGIGHGHVELDPTTEDSVLLRREAGNLVANAALPQYVEVTESNRDSFHFHADPEDRPLTAVLAVPPDIKSGTLLRGRYLAPENRMQVLRPSEVVAEMMETVAQLRRFLDLNFVLVAVLTALFLVLVVLLSLRLREREMDTLFLLGARVGTVGMLMATELLLVLLASLLTAVVLSLGAQSLFETWLYQWVR